MHLRYPDAGAEGDKPCRTRRDRALSRPVEPPGRPSARSCRRPRTRSPRAAPTRRRRAGAAGSAGRRAGRQRRAGLPPVRARSLAAARRHRPRRRLGGQHRAVRRHGACCPARGALRSAASAPVLGPYHASHAALVPVDHDVVVLLGSISTQLPDDELVLRRAAAAAMEHVGAVTPAKRLADERQRAGAATGTRCLPPRGSAATSCFPSGRRLTSCWCCCTPWRRRAASPTCARASAARWLRPPASSCTARCCARSSSGSSARPRPQPAATPHRPGEPAQLAGAARPAQRRRRRRWKGRRGRGRPQSAQGRERQPRPRRR